MSEKKTDNVEWGWLIFWVLFVGLAVAIAPFMIGSTWEERGQIGDMFGVVNAIYSGLAFAGLLGAIFLQRKELSLQREELRLTREEVKRSASAQEKSEEALRKQAASLKATAEINALTALLETTTVQLTNTISREGKKSLSAKRQKYIEHIEGILSGKAN